MSLEGSSRERLANPAMRMESPSPAVEVAKDLARRCIDAPVAAMVGAIFWGTDGPAGRYALAIVVVNFLLAAWSLGCGPHLIAPMAGVALFGSLIRLGLITPAVLLVRDAAGRADPPRSRSSSPSWIVVLGERTASASPAFPASRSRT